MAPTEVEFQIDRDENIEGILADLKDRRSRKKLVDWCREELGLSEEDIRSADEAMLKEKIGELYDRHKHRLQQRREALRDHFSNKDYSGFFDRIARFHKTDAPKKITVYLRLNDPGSDYVSGYYAGRKLGHHRAVVIPKHLAGDEIDADIEILLHESTHAIQEASKMHDKAKGLVDEYKLDDEDLRVIKEGIVFSLVPGTIAHDYLPRPDMSVLEKEYKVPKKGDARFYKACSKTLAREILPLTQRQLKHDIHQGDYLREVIKRYLRIRDRGSSSE